MSTKKSHGLVSGKGRALSFDTRKLADIERKSAVKKELKKLGIDPRALEIVQVSNPAPDNLHVNVQVQKVGEHSNE